MSWDLKVKIKWEETDRESETWGYCRALYAYLNPRTDEILYIGSAYHRTVGQRFDDRDKGALFDFLEGECRIKGVNIIIGGLSFDGRLTKQLLFDAESLLIACLNPIGNIMCQRTRISRKGLKLVCSGHWPLRVTRFIDKG